MTKNRKLSSLFVLIITMIAVIAIAITAIVLNNNQTKSSMSELIVTNITYGHKINTFTDSFTTVVKKDTTFNKAISDSRISIGHADTLLLDKYIKENGYTSTEDFLIQCGYLYLYYNFKGTHYYLLQNTTTSPYCWNLLIATENNYELINICDISIEKNSYAKKVEYFNGFIRFYLDCGVYNVSTQNNNNHYFTAFDINAAFSQIYDKTQHKVIMSTKIELLDDTLYVITQDTTGKSFLSSYNIATNEVDALPLYYLAQDITIHNNHILVISIDNNYVYTETLDETSKEITLCALADVNNLELGEIHKKSLWHIVSYDDNLFFSFSTNVKDDEKKTFIFNIDTKNNNRILNMYCHVLNNNNYNIYGVYIYIL